MAMDPAIKAKWCEALRSDRFVQEMEKLRGRGNARCCLGVLCDVALEMNPSLGRWESDEPGAEFMYYREIRDEDGWAEGEECGEGGELPPNVARWAGLANENPSVVGVLSGGGLHSMALSAWNDDEQADFKRIADMIEAQL